MKVCGIVCEYNPFHNGHAYHITQARKISNCDILVCVMSGNATQRGEMAIADKWKRARVAVEHGCDLVVELPYPFVVQRGDRFAHGALHILKQAGIDAIVFGSECNDLSALQEMSFALPDDDFPKEKGISSAKALEIQFGTRLSSNDMLGIFYLKELVNTHIQPYCIQRTNDYHDLCTDTTIASASAIRNAFHHHQDIRHMTSMDALDLRPWTWEELYPYLQTFLLTASKDYLSSLFLMDEGIESLLKKQAARCNDWTSFITSCISKRYTRSSIQRTLMHALTQTTKEEMNDLPKPQYLRPLAFSKRGQRYLRTLQNQGINIASSFHQIPAAYRSLELRMAAIYASPCTKEERALIMKRELLCAEIIS